MCCENPQYCLSHLLVQYSCCCRTLWKTSRPDHMLQGPRDFPWPRQMLFFVQARDGAPPRPARQKWPEQTEGPYAAQPILHKGAASQDQCWTKPLSFSAMPSFSDRAFQAHLALAQVIKCWGGNSLPNSTQASWITLPWCLSTCIKALQMSRGRWAWRKLSMVAQLLLGGISLLPPPTSPASIPPGTRLRQQLAVPSYIPSSCCPPATSTSRWCGELHQWESSQGLLVYSKKQKWSVCHLCKQPGAPQCRKHRWVKPLQEKGTTCPAPQPCRREWREPCTL